MGISFYYAVRILWRECGREFLTNAHKQKIPKITLRTFCGMDETRARATRVPARASNFDNPSKPPLDRGGLVGREFQNPTHIKSKSPKSKRISGILRYGRDSNSRPPA